MKKSLAALFLAIILFPSISFAQTLTPVERETILQLITVLLQRIEELRAEIAERDAKVTKEDKEKEELNQWVKEQKAKQEAEDKKQSDWQERFDTAYDKAVEIKADWDRRKCSYGLYRNSGPSCPDLSEKWKTLWDEVQTLRQEGFDVKNGIPELCEWRSGYNGSYTQTCA